MIKILFFLQIFIDFQIEEIQKIRVMNREQKLFVVLSKEILAEYIRKRHNSKPPTRKLIFNLYLQDYRDLRDQRTVSSGRKLSVRSQEDIDAAKKVLENER